MDNYEMLDRAWNELSPDEKEKANQIHDSVDNCFYVSGLRLNKETLLQQLSKMSNKDLSTTISGITGNRENLMEEYAKQKNAALLSTVKRLQEENEKYKAALTKIVNPINYLHEEAKKEGAFLNGMIAVQLSKDPEWLRSIALKALEVCELKQLES